jgi:hypothetical protein
MWIAHLNLHVTLKLHYLLNATMIEGGIRCSFLPMVLSLFVQDGPITTSFAINEGKNLNKAKMAKLPV